VLHVVEPHGQLVGRRLDLLQAQHARLLAIEQVVNANGNFRILLTPKNDPISRWNHFHIEARSDYRSPDVP